MKHRIINIVLCCMVAITLVTASCKKTTPEPITESPLFEPAECLFTAPQGYDVECGYLTVPEDRSQPDGTKIKIYVGVFRTKNPNPEPDPIVYLAGGPGEHALDSVSLMFERKFAPLLNNRDLIVFDQRGTGYSQPSLFCPELLDLYYDNLERDVSFEESMNMEAETLRTCYERFISEGIDLNAYNSIESAADLHDLRLALGYEEWNLLGISYGTRLALTAMRDYPEGIRSVILASTVPLQTDLYTGMPDNFFRALGVFFADCAADPDCSRLYPDLETTLMTAIDRLNESSVPCTITHPMTGETYDILLDGNGLISFVFNSLYSSEVIPHLPKIIADAADGRFGTLEILMGSTLLNAELLSTGMHYSVQFSEEFPFNDPEDVEASLAEYPEFREYFAASASLDGKLFDIAEYWNTAEPDPREDEPVSSAIPTLILAGNYDPITPPAWGLLASETLENSYFFEIPGVSHDTVFSEKQCVIDITTSFIDNPLAKPGDTCLAGMGKTDFLVLDVDLVPFTSDLYGFSGLSPEGWQEIAPAAWQRSSLGITALAQQTAPGMKADDVLDILKTSLGVTGELDTVETRNANGLEWTVYRTGVSGITAVIALSENEKGSYLMLFSCVRDDYDYYYRELMLPIIDAFNSDIEK
jgi:pimeloyl-ACP methyl ester carboxylesterase